MKLPALAPAPRDDLGFVGRSAVITGLRAVLHQLARTPWHVLICGPSGAGKERVAQALHALSGRPGRPLVDLCAPALPPGLIDAELFGYRPNYPNPGTPGSPGIFGRAHGGTVLLDEIGDHPLSAQAHL